MLVKNIVHKQLKAMGAKNYEIGVDSSHEAEQFIIKTVSLNEILDLKFLKWLQACNCNGRNIYIRPIAPSNLSFVDDVSIETLKCLEEENLIPCCIVESSPNNFHLWFKHSDILDNDNCPACNRSQEVDCPICLEKWSVRSCRIMSCGHGICYKCIARSWSEQEEDITQCPQCRAEN